MLMNPFNEEERGREAEEALGKSQSMAAAGQFAAAIMHEINNPLEAISNLAYLVQEQAEDPDKVREYIRLLDEQLVTVIRIANQTLSFYRPAGVIQVIDLVSLAEAALRVHEKKISAKQLRLLELFSISYRAAKGSLNHAVASLGVMDGSIWATA